MLTIAALIGIFVGLLVLDFLIQFFLETCLNLSGSVAEEVRRVITYLLATALVHNLLH